MRIVFAAMFAALSLAGCVMAPIGPMPTVGNSEPDLAQRAQFLRVVDNVEPVIERICREVTIQRDCDFLIVVDTAANMPANAYQTVDQRGRPVIAFTTALLNDIQNDDELAFVLGHEASHHIAGHLEQTQRNAQIGAEIFSGLAGLAGSGVPQDVALARELGAAVGARAYSKDYELEADRMAARITTIAGYDAWKGAQFFFRIPDPGDRFLGSHPANADRVRAVQNVVAGLN